MFIANNQGIVKQFDDQMALKLKFQAYESGWNIIRLKYLEEPQLLLTIAEKQGNPVTLHLWDLEKIHHKTHKNAPHLHTTVKVTNGTNAFPLSAFDINSDYSILGFGFADGTVILVRGDILHDRGSRQRVVFNSNTPITGINIHESNGVTTLFVTSVTQVFTLPSTGRNPGKVETLLEKNQGAAVACSSLDTKNKLVVARESDITYYTTRLRETSFVFDVPKKSILPYKHYLVIASSGSNGDSSTTALNSLIDSSITRLLVIDAVNKYVAFSGQISQGIKDMYIHHDQINVLGSDGVLYTIREKDLDSRLNILKQRNLYDVSIQLASSLQSDRKIIASIERDYGDFLYNQGEADAALTHYINSIDLGQTSQVILKYRESHNIGNLTKYLEELHTAGLATSEHTTLLMNSYAKLKDDDKLKDFILNGSKAKSFDFETAIKICRHAGYYNLAFYLAETSEDSDLAVQVKLRDLKDYKGCLTYIQTLEVNDALRVLIQHSRVLLDEYPVETTALLIQLFTGKYKPKPMESTVDAEKEPASSSISAPVLQSYKAFVSYMSSGLGSGLINGFGKADDKSSQEETEEDLVPSYQPPKPRLIFSSFLDHPNEFVIFLEACLESYDTFEANEKDRVDLLSTLFEMYLTLANKATDEQEKERWRESAKELGMDSRHRIGRNTMLLLSHISSYREGELLARSDQEGFEVDLFRACMASQDVKGAIDVLHKYGDREKELYVLALTFFTSSEAILEEAGEEFDNVLNTIKKDRIMAPLQVIQALSVNSVATIGHVRAYLLELITSERNEIDNNNKLAEMYKAEATDKQQDIEKLLHDPIVVQYTLCGACNMALDLPAVHFACKHSYHERCLGGGDDFDGSLQCPKCQPKLEDIRAVRRAQEEVSERTDLFLGALEESDNKFKLLTDYIGRGSLTLM